MTPEIMGFFSVRHSGEIQSSLQKCHSSVILIYEVY